ncbi:WD40 repeat-like protein [Auricularia subglabra TFB-10046 SS5]|uniref:WD40 repeat-like protein n=1 Tax=Auricularia subglabra (strain TFB-10046 / SS5) TaxID=717982 RepID=J0WLB4_AURST|nr:WD40 repeat-like protein [Auricularia subglabra TFB-10046 SS5]
MAPRRYIAQTPLSQFHRDPVISMDFDPTGRYLVSIDAGHQLEPGNQDSEFSAYLVVWNVAATSPLRHEYALEMKFGLSQVLWLDFGLVVAGRDGTLTVITQDEGTHRLNVVSFLAHPSLIQRMAFSKTTNLLLTASVDGLVLWNTPVHGVGLKRRTEMQHACSVAPGKRHAPFTVTGLYWLSDSQFIVAYMDHHFVIWDIEQSTRVREISCRGQEARVDAAFYGSTAAVSFAKGLIELYDVEKNFFAGEHEHDGLGASPCLLVHSGTALVHGTEDGKVVLRNAEKIKVSSAPNSGIVVLEPRGEI